LHPDINDFMSISRTCFPNGMVRIITNGILLPKMTEAFWRNCRENNIVITITVYPLRINYWEMKQKAEKFGVTLVFWGDPMNVNNKWRKSPIDLSGKHWAWLSNAMCYAANYCFQLVEGRLYKCWRIAYIDYFNKTFHKNLPVTKKDYVDIYEENSIHAILKKLCRSAPFCRFCDMRHPGETEWGVSRKDIAEWIDGSS